MSADIVASCPPQEACAAFAASTWDALEHAADERPLADFDPATLDGLPSPAQRFLAAAVPPGTPLWQVVRLEMRGDIKLAGRWMPFTATQILRAGVGLVWNASVGGRWLRFVGADALGPDMARLEFRLRGRLPIVRAEGDDIRRSAGGRLAAETVAWLPQALTPQAGARWVGRSDERATVTIGADGTDIDIDVAVDRDGQLRWLSLQRWNSSAKPPAFDPFGGSIDETRTTPTGVRIAGAGTVAWGWHPAQPADDAFFRYEIVSAAFGDASSRTAVG